MTHGPTQPPRSAGYVDLGDADLNARIADGLAAVEKLLHDELSKGEDFLVDKVLHLIRAGGKRFRPMMALLASEYGPKAGSDEVIRAAAVVEITHLATLYHDDVMDEAELRRGVESANSRWDNSVAILAGDILLAHASRLMSGLGRETVFHFAETFGDLVTGQMRETVGPGDSDPIEHYTKVIREKTGVLIASAGYLGALHGGASDEHIDALKRLGEAIGIVFQIVDDIIDIYSDPDESGKTPGTDLREGVFTLPVLHALQEDTEVGEELRGLLTGPLTDDASVERALELLARSTGREKALADVHRYLAEAEEQVSRLPDNEVTRALGQLAGYTVRRVG
ncbi:polyprenyl synthetase family protein [Corynebacterium halotolerans]|uniref:Putative polyprenyl diphosphate synthase component n=1 Tax=Corynebacterium halotolerans YIM 70093 = DSM 44683 TaxID=1121362 RepID=M1NVH1_9CORY|nr:polyprenyl synthetase family protein [Corynebacterium halotolerans]AGF71480.1 putative polyprenyl diphosphate synthase component [Corynebacterium halotolerans YIM 70093 = DSM 44683]